MKLLNDTIFYSFANWGRRIVGFITAPILISFLSPSEYGYINFTYTTASFFSILGMLAIVDQGLPRFFIDAEDLNQKKSYVSVSFITAIIGNIGCVLIILFSTPFIKTIFKDINSSLLFTTLVAFTCISQSILYIGINMLKWTFQSHLFAKITLSQTIIGALATVGGVYFLGWNAKEVILINATTGVLAGIFGILKIKEYISMYTVSKKTFRELAIYSWPLLGLNIFAYFTRSLDRIFIASLASFSALGVFAVSYTVASVFEILVSGFFLAWGPYVFATYKDKNAPHLYAKFFSAIVVIGLVCIVMLGYWGATLVEIIRPDGKYNEIGIYIPWIISGILIYYLGSYFTPGPTIKKRTHWKLIGFIIAGTLNALLNYSLIPKYGILGAGIATTISSLIAGIFNQIISNRFFFVPNRWKFSFFIIIIFTCIVSFSQSSNFFCNIEVKSYWIKFAFTFTMIAIGFFMYYQDLKTFNLLYKVKNIIIKNFAG